MKSISRRQFLLGLVSTGLAGLHLVSDSELLAYPAQEASGVKELNPVDCDYIIENANIIDGSGKPPFHGAIAVKDDKITAVGLFAKRRDVLRINAGGRVVCPGFIDIHSHTENYLHYGGNPQMILTQGVTTQIGGNCGSSPSSTAAYFESLNTPGVNVGLLTGYKTVRRSVMPDNTRKASFDQIKEMQVKIEKEMQAGAFGFSVGLEYYPQVFASTEELIELCQVVKEYGGFYATHLRSESDKLQEAFEEALTIGEKSKVKIEYSHTKASFAENWDKHSLVLETLSQTVKNGMDIAADIYYYTFSGWDIGTNPLRHSISEENIKLALLNENVCIGSDSGIYSGGRVTHPRAYGNYPRIIKKMLAVNLLPLEKIVYKMTGMPAKRLSLQDRGLIKTGYKADLICFEPQNVSDKATYENPMQLSEGIDDVWLNGKRVVENGQFNGLYYGEPVLHKV